MHLTHKQFTNNSKGRIYANLIQINSVQIRWWCSTKQVTRPAVICHISSHPDTLNHLSVWFNIWCWIKTKIICNFHYDTEELFLFMWWTKEHHHELGVGQHADIIQCKILLKASNPIGKQMDGKHEQLYHIINEHPSLLSFPLTDLPIQWQAYIMHEISCRW